jgi:hypothetical protein
MNPGLTLLLVFGIGVPALRILIETPRDTPVLSAILPLCARTANDGQGAGSPLLGHDRQISPRCPS